MLLLHLPPDYIKDVLISILKSVPGELFWEAGKEAGVCAAAVERPQHRQTDNVCPSEPNLLPGKLGLAK